MIKLYSDKSYQHLYVRLLKLLIENNSVFQETWIIVPNHSAKQWLQKSLAKSLGVCAQIKFIMPLSFNWEILKNVVTSDSTINIFSNDVLRWHIYQLIIESDDFKFLKNDSAIENFNLAEKIAQTLLKYSDERPELINDWDNGLFKLNAGQEWQAEVWIKLLSILKEGSPVQLLQKFDAKTNFKQKPNKIILFATEQLTSFQKDTILKLGQHQDIHLLLSNPSPNEYWFDSKPSAAIARDKLFNSELAYLNDVGNPLLANLGYNKMAIFDAFLNHDIEFNISSLQKKPNVNSLLSSIKNDIFELIENSKTAVDDSIKIHSCHNTLREVEIIKDEILSLLDNDKNLNPEDIIVVSPDINEYVFAIKEVFNYTLEGDSPYVPFHIDRVQLADNNYITSLMNLLHSFNGEMTAPVIYELLSQSIILEKLNMTEDDLPRIKTWIIDSNIRNFYSASEKRELKYEAKIGNTWNFGENRWLSGYLSGESDDTPFLSTFGDIAGQEQLFTQTFNFLSLWFKAYKVSQKDHSPQKWYVFIKNLCRDFLYNDFDLDFEKQITQLLENKFMQQTLEVQAEVPLTIINGIVETVITENNFRSEGQIGIRFQTWENAFVVDAKVLIIMGLNDGEFPKKEIKSDLDIFNNLSPRLNKSSRQRDKNLMLTALTENIEILIMTYIGFDPKTNDPQPPSVLLADMINYLEIKTNNQFKVHFHNMHGFNKNYFSGNCSSYNTQQYQLAQSYYKKHIPVQEDTSQLNLKPETDISLKSLMKYFTDPLDFFLKNRANINLHIYEDIIQDTETYFPSGLESWELKNQIFKHDQSTAAKTGLVSDNKSGQSLIRKYINELNPIQILAHDLDLQTHMIELELSGFKIFGSIQIDKKQQLTSIYPSKVSTKNICKHWIKHLCYQSGQTSYVHFEDKSIEFAPLENSKELLLAILDKWQQSFKSPWLFCPASSIKFTTKIFDVKARKDYLKQFIETDNSFPSEGQKYFFNQIEAYHEQVDIDQFIKPLIESLNFFDAYENNT